MNTIGEGAVALQLYNIYNFLGWGCWVGGWLLLPNCVALNFGRGLFGRGVWREGEGVPIDVVVYIVCKCLHKPEYSNFRFKSQFAISVI